MSLSRTVSEINGVFSRKSQILLTNIFNAPLKGFPLQLGIGAWGQETSVMALPGRGVSLAVHSAV